MSLYEFTFTIDQFVEDLDVIDGFYGKTGDASIAGEAGKTMIHFDRTAQSLDDALRSAVADVRSEGWQVLEISVEPHCLLATPAS